jgi:hypothetical protein
LERAARQVRFALSFKGEDLSSWQIANLDYNKLNKGKKTVPEAFYYFFSALELLGLAGG